MEQPRKTKDNIQGLCRNTPVGDTRSSIWEHCDIPVSLAFCPCFLILPLLLFPTLLPSNKSFYEDIWDPAHNLTNPDPLFLSRELLIVFFPSRSSQFSAQPKCLPDSLSLTLQVTFRIRFLSPTAFHASFHTSALTLIYKPGPRLPNPSQSLHWNSALCSSLFCSENPPHCTVVYFVPVWIALNMLCFQPNSTV